MLRRASSWPRAVAFAALATLAGGCRGHPPDPPQARARDYNLSGAVALNDGDLEGAEHYFQSALSESDSVDDTRGRAIALINLSRVDAERWAIARAKQRSSEAITLARQAEDGALESVGLATLASLESLAGQHERATTLARSALELARTTRRRRATKRLLMANRRVTLAWVLGRAGSCAEAQRLLDSANAAFEKGRDVSGLAAVAHNRAHLAIASGQPDMARDRFHEALNLDKGRANPLDVADDLEGLAIVAERGGDHRAAAAYLDRTLRVHTAVGASRKALANVEHLISLNGKAGDAARTAELRAEATRLRAQLDGAAAFTPAPARTCRR